MDIDFQLDFLNTIIILRDYDGRIIKTSKQLTDNFFQMHLLTDDIYLDNNNNYWKKNTKLIVHQHHEYFQEEYVNITDLFLKNEKLLEDLKKDPLTKIANINAVKEKINNIIMTKGNCFIAMCDVNDFKIINDTYGHANGDKSLIELSKLFMRSIRENYDMVARIGGDEFLLILMDNNLTDVFEKLNLLEQNVVELGNNLGIPLSISIGISYFEYGNKWNIKQNEADNALYYVKHNVDDKNAIAYYNKDTESFNLYCNYNKKYIRK